MSMKNNKKPSLYVEIYNKLLKLISKGVYPIGSKLPTEEELSKMMDVSRKTLRQALSLLKDDGYIEAIHGQGNFIKQNVNVISNGLEIIDNTVLQSITLHQEKLLLLFCHVQFHIDRYDQPLQPCFLPCHAWYFESEYYF